ncbi:transcriptional regulator with XRE-family HTH domain/Zn-dependent peptidase ImmA (M78 family) [Saccharothrix coeruleofusca]|uniref:XRE family transcriptional regulator n=1 Tax=Saccharothrix coeruleofusca TaxID=33919 RepID=UPI001AEA41F2|nr:XRE family transcriptional regulator [Saccharothrix coeruleofusca]MBP2334556.1 transcriptional regulator with XRE-family HTH domain/Zn-dependent peptidase ImmA (M78 family) [Saccharothrix coeruleofusca]
MLTPSRLALARTRRGLTATELARKAGVSPRSIGDYERGRRQPGEATVTALAAALGFPVAFLSAPEAAELAEGAVAFSNAAPKSRRAAAISAGRLAVEFGRWLARAFALPATDVPRLEHPDPETAAGMVRARWGMGSGPAPNVVHLLEAHGVRVFSLPTDCAEVGTFSFWHAGTPHVLLDPTATPERGRFEAARELGRLVLPKGDANAFASAFLLPRAGVLASVPAAAVTRHVIGQGKRWHVSALALTYRLRDLGLLTVRQYQVVCAELSRREPDGMARREDSQLLTKVFRALRDRGITPHQVAHELLFDVEELNSLVFGLVFTALPGAATGRRRGRADLSLVPPRS